MTRLVALLLVMLSPAVAGAQGFAMAWAGPAQYPSGYDYWLENMLITADYQGGRWVDGTYTSATLVGASYQQYEPWYGFRRLADHVGPGATATALESYAVAAGDAWRTDLVDDLTPDYAVQAIYIYTDGLTEDWVRNGDTASRDAVLGMQNVQYGPDVSNLTWLESADDSAGNGRTRECAYALLSYINSEVYCGATHRTRMPALVTLILGDINDNVVFAPTYDFNLDEGGHIEQWLGDYVTDANGDYVSGTTRFVAYDYAPFFGSITAYVAIRYYEEAASIDGGITPDARVVTKLTRLADATWNEMWAKTGIEGHAGVTAYNFVYRWSGTESDSTPLNGMIFHWYAWLYKETGEPRFKTRAELIFNGMNNSEHITYVGAATQVYIAKNWNQLLRWTIDGLDYYAAGVAAHE